jgi:hypothetical protein
MAPSSYSIAVHPLNNLSVLWHHLYTMKIRSWMLLVSFHLKSMVVANKAQDLELLAQNDRKIARQDTDLGFEPASWPQLSFQCGNAPQNISRFFQRELGDLLEV